MTLLLARQYGKYLAVGIRGRAIPGNAAYLGRFPAENFWRLHIQTSAGIGQDSKQEIVLLYGE